MIKPREEIGVERQHEIAQLKSVINDLVLVVNMFVLHGRKIDESDPIKAERIVAYACKLADLPETIQDVAKSIGIADYPPTRLEVLRDAVLDMTKTACGTYNEKRVSVDKKKFNWMRELAIALKDKLIVSVCNNRNE